MNNYKTFFKIQLLVALFSLGFARAQTLNMAGKVPGTVMIIGPTGQLIPAPTITTPQFLSCAVNGITITTSGSYIASYAAPLFSANASCTPSAPFVGLGEWTGNVGGILTYTFSQPITSARIAYSAVNIDDIASIVTNSSSIITLCDPCGLTISGNNIVKGSFAVGTYGDAAITVASATPFTTITLTDMTGTSGFVIANPCNFIINPPVLCPNIVNCPKVALETKYYKATAFQDTTLSVFTAGSGQGCNGPATINGVPCTAANVTIEQVFPLPFGCSFNPNGTIRIPAGTRPFEESNHYNYRFRSIANPNIYSIPYRVDFGIQPRVILVNTNNVYLTVKPTGFNGLPNPGGIANPYGTAGNLFKNVLTGSTIYTSTDGGADTAPANYNAASAVTVTETTSPIDPYFMINPDGTIGYRPSISSSTFTIPLLPQLQRVLTFRVCLTNGCPDFYNVGSSTINYFYPPLRSASSTNNLDTLVVAPNPASDGIFQVSFDQFIKEATLEVHTLTGEKVQSQLMHDTDKDILLLSKLPKGIYVLKVITDDQTVSKKISIE